MSIEKTIVVDARMIKLSGIGRYLKSMIFALIDYSYNWKIVLIGNSTTLQEFELSKSGIHIIELKTPIYSITEQIVLPFKIPKCDLFITPHYNFPIFSITQRRSIVFFPDVNHLAMTQLLSLTKRLYAKALYNLASLRANSVITISDFSKSEIKKLIFFKPRKIIVAKCGFDSFNEDDATINEIGYRYILYVGNVKPHKNLYNALIAFEKCLPFMEDTKFCIVGKKEGFITGDNEVSILLQNRKDLRNMVVFTGYISDSELTTYYKNAELFFFPSLYEGFGLPPLEAMSLGCPVLASSSSSIPEICGNAALFCDPNDLDDMSKKLILLYSDRKLRQSLVNKGFERIKEFSWESFNEKLLEEIDLLVGR